MAWSLADRIFYKMLKIPMNGVLDPDVIGSGGVGHRLLRERGRPVRIPGPRARATLLQAPPRQSVKQSKDHAYRMLLPYRRPGRRWRHGADGTGTVNVDADGGGAHGLPFYLLQGDEEELFLSAGRCTPWPATTTSPRPTCWAGS